MDDQRFDHLTRTVFAFGSRRAVTKTLIGGSLGAILAHVGGEEAAARCVELGDRCQSRDGDERRCCGGAECRRKRCTCSRRRRCGATCCRKDQVCAGGRCIERGTCPTNGADVCTGFSGSCAGNDDCGCFTTMTNDTRCGLVSAVACGQCTTDADCGPARFCVKVTGSECGCDLGSSFCGSPCPV